MALGESVLTWHGKVKKDNEGLGGRGKLTGKLIDELSVYYGLAIRNHCNSVEDMKNAIWATFDHKSSTNEEPQHELCPPGKTSWCTWGKAEAQGNLRKYQHKPALHKAVQKAMRPVYKALTDIALLERCLGGYNQNCNESLNALIWKIAPKISFSALKVVEIATYLARSIYNDGYSSILLILYILKITIGPCCYDMCNPENEYLISIAQKRAKETRKEARTARRRSRLSQEEQQLTEEGPQYGAGIAD